MNSTPEPPFILVAEDDPAVMSKLRDALRLAGAQVATCRSVPVAVQAVEFHVPNVVVADVLMDGGKGWEVVYAARARGQLPTVVLDRGGAAADRRAAFAAGVDDVVPAGIDAGELAARVMALAARTRQTSSSTPVYRLRGLVLDVGAHSARLNGRPVSLTAQQFAILRALFEANGATLERSRLLARIEALDDEPPSERAIDLHVTRLRRRLADDARKPKYIAAVYGVGYRLASDDGVAAQELGDRAEDVLAALPDALLVIDTERHIRFANEAAARLIARDRAEIIGLRCGEVLACTDCDGLTLDGPRCYARIAQNGVTALRDVPARVRIGEEQVDVAFTYAHVQQDGLLTLGIKPRTETT